MEATSFARLLLNEAHRNLGGLEAMYSVDETARRLGGISKHTIHAWFRDKKLRRTKVGRRTMVSESEIERFIRECNRETDHSSAEAA